MSEEVTSGSDRPHDYLLVVGPGRSGSTFLYRLLNAHPAFAAPSIKEGYYYRSVRRFVRARRKLPAANTILLDVANTAWADPRLGAVEELRRRGHRVLLVVLLRRHRERAVSVMAFRRSRVLPGACSGPQGLERAAIRESLTAPALARIFGLGANVLVVGFETLVGDPRVVLDVLARLCATPAFASDGPCPAPVNRSVRARHPLLAGAGKAAAVFLRGVGAHRLLQALKDNPRVMGLFFRPMEPAARPGLSAEAEALLDRHFNACLAALDAAGERIGDGLWFIRGPCDPAPAAPRPDGRR